MNSAEKITPEYTASIKDRLVALKMKERYTDRNLDV